jgi:hypothetical protein
VLMAAAGQDCRTPALPRIVGELGRAFRVLAHKDVSPMDSVIKAAPAPQSRGPVFRKLGFPLPSSQRC